MYTLSMVYVDMNINESCISITAIINNNHAQSASNIDAIAKVSVHEVES